MNSIHEIQRTTLHAVYRLHLPRQSVQTVQQEHISSLKRLSLWLLPFSMVTATALIAAELQSVSVPRETALTLAQGQRLDIATHEPQLLEPGAEHLMGIEPPVLHAAAPAEPIAEKTQWILHPPTLPAVTVPHEAARSNPHAERGVFLTPSSAADDDFLKDTMDRISVFSHPALVVDVKGSAVYFLSGAPMATELKLVRPLYDLPAIVSEAHRRGITVIGRFIALKDPSLASRKSETQIRHPLRTRSVGSVWVDAENAVTLQYNREILEDLVQSGIDEINLDYIRYPTEYAPSEIGLSGAEKAAHIEKFLLMAREVIDASGRDTKLGISTFAILGWNFPMNFEPLGQDIPRFAEIVDVISPMAYPSTFSINAYYDPARDKGSRMYSLVLRTLLGYRDLVGPQNAHKIRPWIQGYGVTEKNMHDQMQAVFDADLCGFTVWSASNTYGPAYKAMTKMEVPEKCMH